MSDLDDVGNRLRKLYAILVHELEVLAIERKLGSEVRQQMEKLQRDYYLREKIKVIQKELGDQDGRQAAIEEYKTALKKKKCPDSVRKVIEKEIRRLEGMSGYSSETGVVRTYLDCLLSLPWEDATKETVQIKKAEHILEHDHYGLKKVKERILDYLAVYQLVSQKNNDRLKRWILFY